MIILGDTQVPHEQVKIVNQKDEIKSTQANSTLLFAFDGTLMHYCKENGLSYGVVVFSLKEAIYANALGAKYIICKQALAKEVQSVAENYMYDAKVMTIIQSSDDLEVIAMQGIDGVIHANLLEGLIH